MMLLTYVSASLMVVSLHSVILSLIPATASRVTSEALAVENRMPLPRKLIWLGMLNPNQTLMACEPSFPMIRTVFIPAMDEALESLDIPFTFRASPQPEYQLDLPTGSVKILCQSAENYQRIRGQNIAAACGMRPTRQPTETAQKAGEMLLARMRTGQCNQLAIASTPEGVQVLLPHLC